MSANPKEPFIKAQILKQLISIQKDWLHTGECLSPCTALYFASVTTYLVQSRSLKPESDAGR